MSRLGWMALPLVLPSLLAGPAAASTDSALDRVLRRAGPDSGAAVVPLGSRSRALYERRATRALPLASLTKLFTAAMALDELAAVSTTVVAGAPAAGGVVAGDLALVGGGDPSFGSPSFAAAATPGLAAADPDALARMVVDAGVREVSGSVIGDESRFDAVRGGPATRGAFDPELGGPLSALAWNRGRAPGSDATLSDPARGAAAAFDDALERLGVTVRGVPRTGAAPSGGVELARLSTPVPPLVRRMLVASDNWIAELLAKALVPADRGPASTALGAATVAAYASDARPSARVALVDGSGRSGRSRGGAREVTDLLRAFPRLRARLARAGRDGTLHDRLHFARDRCRAKSGTLDGRRNLAGVCRLRSGRFVVFALLLATDEPRVADDAVRAILRLR